MGTGIAVVTFIIVVGYLAWKHPDWFIDAFDDIDFDD